MKYQINIEEKEIDYFRNILISSLNSCTHLSKGAKKLATALLNNIDKVQSGIITSTFDWSVNNNGETRDS